jgi:hypothetical protein
LLIILHVALLVIVIRIYLVERTPAVGLLLLACIAYTLARFAWFSFDLAIDLASLPFTRSTSPILAPWKFYSTRLLHVAFMLFIIFALRAMRRDRARDPESKHLTNRCS